MYRIALKDVGMDRVTKDFTIPNSSLAFAELKALGLCRQYLLSSNVEIKAISEGEYVIYAGFHPVGSFTITKL